MFPRDSAPQYVPGAAAAQAGQQNAGGSAAASGATAPPDAPSPPAFGANAQASGKRQRARASQSGGFGSTILGLNSAPAPLGTKTLLGQ